MNSIDNSAIFAGIQAGRHSPVAQLPAAEPSVLQQYIAIGLRWRRPILATIAGFILLGVVATFLMTPKYTASALIEIAREGNRIAPVQGVEKEATDQDLEFYQTQYGLLQSNELAEQVVDELRFADDPAFFALFGEKPAGANLSGANGELPVAQHDQRRRQAARILLRNLSINPVRLSRLVGISFTSPDAKLSARVTNTWTTKFIGVTLARRYEATAYARNFLENRLGQLRERLEASERQLVDYASRERLINIPAVGLSDAGGERSIVAQNLAALNAELTAARADRIKQEARVGGATDGAVPEALENSTISGLRQKRAELSADYQKLLVQFQPEYPAAKALKSQIDQLDRSIDREQKRVSSSLLNKYRDSSVREQQLASDVDRLKNQLLDQRRRSIQYTIFQREADTNRQLYDALLQRYKEIGVASGVGVNNISIVDQASDPEKPSSPKLLLNLLLSGLAGVAAGAALAFVLEQTANSFDDPAEVERDLDIPLLGTAPRLDAQDPVDAIVDRKSHLVEAYLSVETNLRFATEHGLPRSFAVTSTRPGEGKSTTSLALAVLLSRTGKRVLLVDGDMRSPSVHQLLGLPNERGLSDALAGDDQLRSLISPVERFGITAMAAGPNPPSAAELLVGDRLASLLDAVSHEFDHVIIDSPPVMGLADALLIGSRVEGVVFTIESHEIRKEAVRVALTRLRSAHVRVFGAILTKFHSGRSHLGYGYDYGYGYGQGHADRQQG